MMVLMENIRLKEYCVDVYTYIVDHSHVHLFYVSLGQ